jgi:hypothetical protein
MSDNEIELPKPKRTYRKKSAVPVEQPIPSDNLDVLTDNPVAVEPSPKPKRVYRRKSAPVVSDPTESLSEDEHDTVAQLLASLNTPEPLPSTPVVEEPEPSIPSTPSDKTPRSDKQIASFEKMRLARIAKSNELKHLKELEKERQLLDKESAKVSKMETKIVKRRSKKAVVSSSSSSDEDIHQPPKLVKQVSTMPTILFV